MGALRLLPPLRLGAAGLAPALLLFLQIWLVFASDTADVLIGGATGALVSGIAVTVLVRFGLLAQAVLFFTLIVLTVAPLTLDWSAWYAGRSFATLLFFAVVLLAAAYSALGGKPPFGRALLED